MTRNRLYRADCKSAVADLVSQNVRADLIYLDPPFNSNRTYSLIFRQNGGTAQQKSYHDMWDFTDHTRQLVMHFHTELEEWDLAPDFKRFIRLWITMLEQSTSAEKSC